MEKSVSLMYERLAEFLVENLDFKKAAVVLEAGCGRGQLTLPLVRKARRFGDFRFIALDTQVGPYRNSLNTLKKNLQREGLDNSVVTVNGDVRDMRMVETESVDLIVSNELLCELNRQGLDKAMREFYRVLKPEGQMAHGELIPIPENEAQRLLIEANDYSMETSQPKPEWFSPSSDEVAALMHRTGFKNIRAKYFETNVRMEHEAAVSELKRWKTHPSFIEKHAHELRKWGLELPMEHVIFCEK